MSAQPTPRGLLYLLFSWDTMVILSARLLVGDFFLQDQSLFRTALRVHSPTTCDQRGQMNEAPQNYPSGDLGTLLPKEYLCMPILPISEISAGRGTFFFRGWRDLSHIHRSIFWRLRNKPGTVRALLLPHLEAWQVCRQRSSTHLEESEIFSK
jgi:hypothetical protein